MRPTMKILFPFLVAIITVCLFAYFTLWKWNETEVKKMPKPALISPKKPQYTVPAETFAPADYGTQGDEGFSVTGASFPRWNGPSIKMSTYIQSQANYKNYANTNLYPSQDLLDTLNSLPVLDEVIPDFGAYLSNFDAEITSIPWDAENMNYLQSKIVWGHVSMDASKSIFTKMYIEKALSDPKNLAKDPKENLLYHSLFLGESAYDPNTATLLTLADTTISSVGQQALVTTATLVYDMCVNIPQNILAKQINSQGLSSLTAKELKLFKFVAADSLGAHKRNSDRQEKLAKGEMLTDADRLENDLYEKRHVGFLERAGNTAGRPLAVANAFIQNTTTKIARILGKPVQAIGRQLMRFGPAASLITGVQTAAALAKTNGPKLIANLARKLATLTAKIPIMAGVTVFINAMSGIITAMCFTPAIGVAAPLAVIINTIAALWNTLDVICMAIFLALQVILPSLMSKAFENGGTCPAGSNTLASLIGDDALYFILTSFIPPIMVLDAFSEYVCYLPNGGLILKNPYKLQPYMADPTLSMNKHSYAKGTEPRGDYTSHKSNTDSLPPGWTLTAGIARGPCDPGTWTSSDVDMLCNISTYVPRTYAKHSHVPRTYAKSSRVPKTYTKKSFVTTYTRSAAIYPVDYQDCNSQWPGENLDTKTGIGTQTLDCWGDSQNTVYMSCGCRRWSC